MTNPARLTFRVKDPAQSVRFYGAVLGCDTMVFDDARARAELPGVTLDLVRFDRDELDAVHGPGAHKHRPGVGVEVFCATPDPEAVAERVRTRGGFLVRASADSVTVRDGDGYALTFSRA